LKKTEDYRSSAGLLIKKTG